ncbi:dioxygenase [Rhizobium indigoferae]|uniref:Dioxygenase n=1 Tax=Rhizobium indigoferae TaxID=158891 RepID=A0ABZ1DRH7_9HYPH|nr:dioxygenase [Rhizobium indigoferae]NNU55515.1 6-chlorohydroxyquinol-1,2-dioxygenase [Rhizobium indigoferae]WRW38057.1 dioxygenase [Rhizobium indigoferae]GLR62393.1 6-chlorohydroxyquinol-1,2-dioxygenase [Rhizobium indigoferae]
MTPGPMALNFSEANSHDMFAQRLPPSKEHSLPQVLAAAVTHLHTLIREVRPTQAEWRQVIEFLTDVGHASDERRQEWVLLSDLLGASALVEEINSRRPKTATPNTVRGPFFRADVPQLPLGGNISLDGIGETLEVSGRVQDLDGDPIANTEIITWQANAQGLYENQQPDLQPEFNLRGSFRTDADGRFYYRTIKPCGYGVPDDGPVGKLLREAGYPLRRPAHLHFIIKAPGFETITTHIYDGSDPHLAEDAIFAVKPELVRSFERQSERQGKGATTWRLDLAFVMVRARQGADT